MKKICAVIFMLVLSFSAFATLNVRKLNEELTLKKPFNIDQWSNYGKEWVIYYGYMNKGVYKIMSITYVASDSSSKGHWKGEPKSITISVTDMRTMKVGFNQLNEMANIFMKYNSDSKQNQALKNALKNRKDTDKATFFAVPEQKEITLKF